MGKGRYGIRRELNFSKASLQKLCEIQGAAVVEIRIHKKEKSELMTSAGAVLLV